MATDEPPHERTTTVTVPALTHVWLEAPLFDDVLARLPAGVAVIRPAAQAPVFSNAAPAQAILASSMLRYDATLMDACPNLRLIARTGIGVDNVDLAAATARGIVVTNTPDGPSESTAEHTVAMLLALAKRLKQGNDNLAAGKWGPRSGVLVGTEVQGKTLGLVGLGRIGRRVAEICRLAFGMRVLAYDPFVPDDAAAAMGVTPAPLEMVIAEADFLSLHVPATPETVRLMNAERLAAMKPGSYLLNLARGPLVDEAALLDALDRGHLAGAGLDVFDPEPPALDSRLRAHLSVIATPHVASLTLDGRRRMEEMAMDRLLAFFHGERPADIVNPAAWPPR
ncbi:MAG: hydroxyacid dehydrogenase [Caldilineaceae bacterium]|nr:hydroxyacid dehydrogenase [Caldilineaceae bacterium]